MAYPCSVFFSHFLLLRSLNVFVLFALFCFVLVLLNTTQNEKAMVSVEGADIAPANIVVRFGEAVDGFPLPKGHSLNPDLTAEQVPGAEAFLSDKKP